MLTKLKLYKGLFYRCLYGYQSIIEGEQLLNVIEKKVLQIIYGLVNDEEWKRCHKGTEGRQPNNDHYLRTIKKYLLPLINQRSRSVGNAFYEEETFKIFRYVSL